MNEAQSRNSQAGNSPPQIEDTGDDSSAGPAPKKRKTTKKAAAAAEAAAAAAAVEAEVNVRKSPTGSTIHDLAAVASQLGPSTAAPSAAPSHSHAQPALPSPSLPHTHTHQHAHAHAAHGAHAHHHHHHHVSPHTLASARVPLAPPPFASSSSPAAVAGQHPLSKGGLNLDTPLQSFTLRDLVAFNEGLQHELGAMRDLMSRTEQHLAQGDRLVSVLQSAIAAASAGPTPAPPPLASTLAPVVPPPPSSSDATPAPTTAMDQERRTEQDLADYLAGLPEMAAVPLPLRKRVEGAPAVGLVEEGHKEKENAVDGTHGAES